MMITDSSHIIISNNDIFGH